MRRDEAWNIHHLWEDGRTADAIARIRDDPTSPGAYKEPIVQELLALAAMEGQCEEIRTLVALGANVNFRSGAGETPLLDACNAGQAEAVRVLIDLGADPNDEGYCEDWPIFMAARSGDVATLDAIVSAGVSVNHENFEEETAVAYAIRSRENTTLKRLIELGADIKRCQHSEVPLRMCIVDAWLPGVRVLVEAGAPIDRCEEYTWFQPGADKKMSDGTGRLLLLPVVRLIGRLLFVSRLARFMHDEGKLSELELARLLVERPETRQQHFHEEESKPDRDFEEVLEYLESQPSEAATPPPAA